MRDLGEVFAPRSVAIVGARDSSPTSFGVVEALHRLRFTGRIYAVNRAAEPAHGLPTSRTCADIGEQVDSAMLLVPAHAVLDVLDDVAAAGATSAVVLSSGWAELGAGGAASQAAIAERAAALGVTLIGPNCLGFMNVTERTGSWTASVPPDLEAGPVAIVSQSGGMGNALADLAAEYGIGLSHVVTTGNEAMLSTTDVIEHLVQDDATRSIAVFAEAIADPPRFAAAARRARGAGKAIVMLKAGSSDLAARNAVSHTGSLVGDDNVVDAALRQLAVIRVRSLEELVVTAAVTAQAGVLRSPGIAVVSISGGSVDVVADEAERLGLPLPPLDETSAQEIRTILPGFATTQNPLDLTGGSRDDEFERVLKALDRQDDYGAVAVLCNVPAYESCKNDVIDGLLGTVGRGLASVGIPGFLLSQTVAHLNATGRASAASAAVTALPGLAIGVAALANLSRWSEAVLGADTGRLPPCPGSGPATAMSQHGILSEWAARELLEPAGVPFVPAELVGSPDGAAAAAARLGTPVALKVVSADIVHKTDVGAVRLHLDGDDAVRRAYVDVLASAARHVAGARVDGVQVAPMRAGGVELLVGVTRDPQWGLVLAVALGGVFVEVLRDVALRMLPVCQTDVVAMLGELRGGAVLDGVRGAPAVDRDALVTAILAIAGVASQIGERLESLEINPLFAAGGRIEALDALVELREGSW